MQILSLLFVVFLAGCSASLTHQTEGLLQLSNAAPQPVVRTFSQSGTVFVGKFATVSALNSRREFVSDYHGEVRITVYPNEKIECTWWVEGRITDESIFDGWNGYIEAYTTLCAGRLQKDQTFEFQGAFIPSGATFDSKEVIEETFSLIGSLRNDSITGDIIIGSAFRNTVTITDESAMPDLGQGVRFTAVVSE